MTRANAQISTRSWSRWDWEEGPREEPSLKRFPSWLLLIMAVFLLGGCGAAKVGGKVLLTPLTLTRDVVDAPLVTLTNIAEEGARAAKPRVVPKAGVGITLDGPTAGIGADVSYFVFKPLSLILGAIDYIPCRSIWPNFPKGLSPWRHPSQSWLGLYFPNTRALWGGDVTPRTPE